MLLVLPTLQGPDRVDPRRGHLVVEMERTTYGIGETVRFSLYNGKSEAVFLACSAPWVVSRAIEGEWRWVEDHRCEGGAMPLGSGATYHASWRSETQNSSASLVPVEPGYYRLDVITFPCPETWDGCRFVDLPAFFWIR
ncbi:MAG: hypothetical protein E6J94_00800 [Methanobacteriota archaeon]|nr:MAG: hypothetical protein E6J99_05515 [Euryarchaeota archaeon]TMA09270.1 MAG: hypothetical protein E6J94_00800 [Euryarchaeota archaeon]